MTKSEQIDAMICATAIGDIGLVWSEAGLRRLLLPGADVAARVEALKRTPGGPRPQWVDRLCGELQRYASGEAVEFTGVPLDLASVDAFRRAIYEAARGLGYGRTATYGDLAAATGHPGLARETGQALGRNPIAIVVPCHRVVAANGKLGGFSAPGGVSTKRRLLAMEMARPASPQGDQSAFAF